MEIALLIIGLLALIPVLYLLWDRYASKPHKVEIDFENTIFARFICPQNKNHGNFGLAFYVLKIVNSSKENLTVKDVLIRYTLDGTEFSTDSLVLLTGSVYAPSEKNDVDAIIVKHGPDDIVLMNWNNLKTEIVKQNILSPGGVLSGSAFFVLNFDNAEAINKLENPEIVVVDYRGKETVHPITVEKEWFDRAKHSLIENRSFTIKEQGNISLA